MHIFPTVHHSTRGTRVAAPLVLALGTLAVAVLASGCGSSGPEVQMVEGMIVLDGMPLEGAVVGFSPVNAGSGLPAAGVTQSDGSFRLTATRGGRLMAGTTVGDYVVTVSKSLVEPVSPPDENDPSYGRGPARFPEITQVVEPRFGDVARSPLRATVSKGFNGGNAFRFEVTPASPAR